MLTDIANPTIRPKWLLTQQGLQVPADTSSPMRSQTVHHAASENPNPPETEQTLNFRTPRLKGQSCAQEF